MTKKYIFLLIIALFGLKDLTAQNDFNTYFEPELNLRLTPENRWDFSFGIASRNLIYADKDLLFKAKHLEISHFTRYNIGKYGKIGAGVLYRFIKNYDHTSHDELRFTQDLESNLKEDNFRIEQRIRLEERFLQNTSFRIRFRLSGNLPFNREEIPKSWSLGVATEALLSLGKYETPSLDQRFTASLRKIFLKNYRASFGMEYRLRNYTKNIYGELYILTGLLVFI